MPECDFNLPPLPCCARCLVRGLASAIFDDEKYRTAEPNRRLLVSFDDDTVSGVRRAPKAGLAKLAKSLDVDAKIMVNLWMCGLFGKSRAGISV